MSIIRKNPFFVTPADWVILDPKALIPQSTPDNSGLAQNTSVSTMEVL